MNLNAACQVWSKKIFFISFKQHCPIRKRVRGLGFSSSGDFCLLAKVTSLSLLKGGLFWYFEKFWKIKTSSDNQISFFWLNPAAGKLVKLVQVVEVEGLGVNHLWLCQVSMKSIVSILQTFPPFYRLKLICWFAFLGAFSGPKKKLKKGPYLQLTFSTERNFLQNTAKEKHCISIVLSSSK